MPKQIEHIAVMRLSAMGDVAMTVPVLRAFVRQYPRIKITVISRLFFQPFFDGIPNLDFFAFDEKGRHKGFVGLLQLYADIKSLNVDAFADLHNVLRSKVIKGLFASAGKTVAAVNKGRAGKKALTRLNNKLFEQQPSMFERHAAVFEKLGFPINLSHPEFPKPQMLDEQTLAITGEKTQSWIGIAPFAQYNSKVYPNDLMQKIIEELAQNNNFKILLFGAKSETDKLQALKNEAAHTLVATGKLTFQQELTLISNLDLMLSMDSGNAHIAAMYGVKVVTLWGATHPFAGFSPYNQPFTNAIVSNRKQFPLLPTSVYGNKKVKGYQEVMRSIPPETVVHKIKSLLSKQ